MTTAEKLAEQIITPIIRWTEAERGRKSQLVSTIQEAAPEAPPTRNLIESWIHPDPEKRKNPTLPNGLLLIAAAVKIGALELRNLPKWKSVLDSTPRHH